MYVPVAKQKNIVIFRHGIVSRFSRWQEMQSGHIFEENEAFNWSQKCRFFRVNICSSQREIEEIQATKKKNCECATFSYFQFCV
jgi:hypothetical protein